MGWLDRGDMCDQFDEDDRGAKSLEKYDPDEPDFEDDFDDDADREGWDDDTWDDE